MKDITNLLSAPIGGTQIILSGLQLDVPHLFADAVTHLAASLQTTPEVIWGRILSGLAHNYVEVAKTSPSPEAAAPPPEMGQLSTKMNEISRVMQQLQNMSQQVQGLGSLFKEEKDG